MEGMVCRACNKDGHMARDCPDKPPMQCNHCNQEGHMARECPEKPPMTCRRCGEEGHMVKECPKPEICKNCSQEGESLSAHATHVSFHANNYANRTWCCCLQVCTLGGPHPLS